MVTGKSRHATWVYLCVLAALAAFAILAYWQALKLPFISDDYVQIRLARDFGHVSGWSKVAADPLYRCRETSLILTYWTEQFFGLNPAAYHWSSLIIHVFNVWLVFALGVWRVIGWRVSAVAAGFFAFYEGHQEAVIWYAALPELLVFFLSLGSLLTWLLWLRWEGKGIWLPLASLALFSLALASKESAVVVVPLLVVICIMERADRKAVLWIAPYALLAGWYAWEIFAASKTHLHLNDGTFSTSAPFLKVLSMSSLRLLWLWGVVALVQLAILRVRKVVPLLLIAGAWIVITFLPYSFLTYMSRVPSRHTYLASLGLSLIVAAWLVSAWERFGERRAGITALLACAMLLQNYGYLWTKKQRQFVERAQPTERLIESARGVDGPMYVHEFPYSIWIARYALEVVLKKDLQPISGPDHGTGAAVFCMVEKSKPGGCAAKIAPELIPGTPASFRSVRTRGRQPAPDTHAP